MTIFLGIFATSNLDLVVSILHKIYSLQRTLIHIVDKKPTPLYGHLHPEYVAILVVSSEHYHCHEILLIVLLITFKTNIVAMES